MSERETQSAILRELGAHPDIRLFRQNVGQAWTGTFVSLVRGRLILDNARPFHAGLCVGSSDLIGWRAVDITPAWIGRRAALFAAVEVKTARGYPSTEQRAFIDAVLRFGGLAGIARSVEQAREIVGVTADGADSREDQPAITGTICEACAALHRLPASPRT